MIAIFPIALTLIFIIYQYRNCFKFGVVSYLMAIYMASSFSSIVLFFLFGYQEIFDLSFYPVTFLTFMVALVFFGFFGFKDKNLKEITLTNFKILKVLEYSIIPFSLLAFGFFFINAYSALSGEVEGERNLIASGVNIRLSSHGILNSICSLIANCFLLNMLFGFLNLTKDYPGRSLLKAALHLFLSTVYIVYILSYVGRDGFVYWVMSFVFFFLFFRDFLPSSSKRVLYSVFLLLALPAFMVFLKISIARFGQGGGGEVVLSFFDYAGQQLFYFNDHFRISPPPMYGAINFAPAMSFKAQMLGQEYEHFIRTDWFTYFLDKDVIPWTFTTFVGSLLHDFGRLGTFFSCLLLSGLARYSLRTIKSGYILLSNLIIFILVFQIVSWGVFYYRQYSAFFYILTFLLIFVFFKFSGGTRQIVLRKDGGAFEERNT